MATLLRFSEAAALALHAMARVAAGGSEVLSAGALARDCGASEAHMIKVCQRLARADLLIAHRGAKGGFTLGRNAGRIRLLEIYTAIEGPVVLKPCLFQNHTCTGGRAKKCVFGGMIMGFEKDVLRFLKATSLASVVARCRPGAGQ
jgi:Rrf2 family protein